MGKIEWNPDNVVKSWMGVCQGFQGLPFISQTLWQVGPMPWLTNFSQGWFGNANWGNTSDTVEISNGNKKTRTPKTDAEKKHEAEEKKAEKRKKDFEQKELKEKHEKLKPLLVSYKETLDKAYKKETDSTKKEELYNQIEDINECVKSVTKDNYEKMLEIYNENKDKIKETKSKEIKDKVTSKTNPQYTSVASNLKTSIENSTDGFGILKKTDSGYEWGTITVNGEEQDIDIMELLSTWNNETSTQRTYIIEHIAKNRKTQTGENKSKYDVLSNQLHDKLKTAAENIDERKLDVNVPAEKAILDALTKAQNDFNKFDTVDKRFPDGEATAGANYSKAFENLYMAIRRAEAMIADKDLEESFRFLGDENPYKTATEIENGKVKVVEGTILAETEKELVSEYRSQVKEVTEPVAPPPAEKTIEEKAAEGNYTTAKSGTYQKEGKYYYYDNASKDFKEMSGVGFVDDTGNCYSGSDNTGTLVGTVKNGVYTASSASSDATASGTGTAPAEGSVENAIGTEYNSWDKMYRVTNTSLHPIFRDEDDKYKLNKESVIGFIDHLDKICTSKKGVIRRLTDIRFDKDNCNKIVKAVMRKALDIGLNSGNCQAYQKLAQYFGALGQPHYIENTPTPDNKSRSGKDTFEFTINTGTGIKYSNEEVEEIDKLLADLVYEIKKLNKIT